MNKSGRVHDRQSVIHPIHNAKVMAMKKAQNRLNLIMLYSAKTEMP
jgi:hypothetical protein